MKKNNPKQENKNYRSSREERKKYMMRSLYLQLDALSQEKKSLICSEICLSCANSSDFSHNLSSQMKKSIRFFIQLIRDIKDDNIDMNKTDKIQEDNNERMSEIFTDLKKWNSMSHTKR